MTAKSAVFITESDSEASVVSLTTISALLPETSKKTAKESSAPEKAVSTSTPVEDKAFSPIYDTQIEKSFGLTLPHTLRSVTDAGKALAAIKPVRAVLWRYDAFGKPCVQSLDSAEAIDFALLQSRGAVNLPECFDCAEGQGPFSSCISSSLSTFLFDGACANCLMMGNELHCSRCR
jgi:hypothetical protein